MGVYQFPVPIPSTVGTFPVKFGLFTDNLSTVTTAGYLNQNVGAGGLPISSFDIVLALYNFNTQTLTGNFGIFTVSISSVNGQITLNSWSNPGNAVLPTTSNYLAHFTNATGTISSGAGNVTQPGNISAGLSGVAGILSSYPSTASKGSLQLAAVANTGNTATIISNAAMGQASTISIPDPGASTANFTLAPSALVNGNLIQANGTAGLLADSGIAASNLMKLNATNTLTSSGSIVANKVNGTEASNAVTASGMAGVITTSSLTTAGGSSYAITWTNTFISSSSVVLLTISGGTNTTENITLKCASGSSTATLTIYNNTAATALNGTILISYLVM